jgi:NAD-dependent SIR2 family protein deacetylase
MSTERAAAALRECFDGGGALVIAAGAGLGVDSGLPDFRGPQGFWRAYPAYQHLGLSFEDLASPRWFQRDPSLAWGFYGHRFQLYQKTVPHDGYSILKAFAARAGGGAFVFTSNVDGAFQKVGFADDRVCEVHGAFSVFQCSQHDHGLWLSHDSTVDVDEATFRARAPFPLCRCGAVARPNILMFGDGRWDDTRTGEQLGRLTAFLDGLDPQRPVVVVEAGAGRAIPTVRGFSEQLLKRFPRSTLVRINVREAHADDGAVADRVVGLADGARAALVALRDLC